MCKINYYYWHTVFGSVKCYHPIKTSVATMVCFFIPQVQILWRDALVTRWISSRWVSWCHLQKRRVQGVYIGQIPGTHTCTLAYKHTPSDLLNTLKPLMVSPIHTRTHMATPCRATVTWAHTHTDRQTMGLVYILTQSFWLVFALTGKGLASVIRTVSGLIKCSTVLTSTGWENLYLLRVIRNALMTSSGRNGEQRTHVSIPRHIFNYCFVTL